MDIPRTPPFGVVRRVFEDPQPLALVEAQLLGILRLERVQSDHQFQHRILHPLPRLLLHSQHRRLGQGAVSGRTRWGLVGLFKKKAEFVTWAERPIKRESEFAKELELEGSPSPRGKTS